MNSSSRDDSRFGLFQQKIPCFFLATSHISTVLRQPLFPWHDVIEIKKKKKEEGEKRKKERDTERKNDARRWNEWYGNSQFSRRTRVYSTLRRNVY